MSHLIRAKTAGSWVRGYKPTGPNMQVIDQNTYLAVNGDEGGTWATTAAITINGAGVVIGGPWTVSGGTTSSGVFTNVASGYTITFGKGDSTDYFQVPNTHPFATQALTAQGTTGYSVYNTWKPVIDTTYLATPRWGMQSNTKGTSLIVPLRVFDGFPVSTITFRFAVTENHANVPDILPSYRAFAVDSAGTILPLRAADSTTSPTGFVQMPAPASGALYTNSLATQYLVYTANQNNVIDISKYSYFGEFIDESGNNSWVTGGTLLVAISCAFSNVSLMTGRN